MAITHSTYGRLGNHIWAYCVARSIAQKKGFDFFSESELVEIVGFEKFTPSTIDNHFPFDGSHHLDEPYYKDVFDVSDNTKLHGFFQNEKYILWNRVEIISWFNVPKYKYFGDRTCVINFRGGDYKDNEVYLPSEYYYNSIKKMEELHPGINFVVITDDIEEAKTIFPNYQCYHFGILEDFSVIKNAKYLIIANSTFSWWGAWINTNSVLTIAPKYFIKYNEEYGDEIQSELFCFMGKDGILANAKSEYSVIIPTIQKAWSITKMLLESILKDNLVGEVILINNGGPPINLVDGKLKIVNLQENIFVNPAWNLGVSLAKFDNIALVNDDIILPNNIFGKIVNLEGYGIVGCNPELATTDETFEEFDCEVNGIKEIGDRPNHFGVFMVFRKDKYIPIPDKYKIWCGDDWLISKNKNNGVLNTKIKIKECATTNLPEFHNRKHLDLKIYEEDLLTTKVYFCNWWTFEYGGGWFDMNNNFFINLLRHKFPNRKFVIDENPNILIFSSFGGKEDYCKKTNCRIIYYSPEVDIISADQMFLFSTISKKSTRLPYWVYALSLYPFFIQRSKNRDNFCSMIATNHVEFRIDFINEMSRYKKVDSSGAGMNNTGYVTEIGESLSGKLNHQSKYKFVTAFENQISEGYVTEKILDAFRAGAVPLYYGTPDVVKDFNPKCFINYNDFNSMEEFCDFIAKVDQDDNLYNSYFEEDIFAPEWRDIVYDKDHPFYTDIAKKIIGDKF